MAGRPSKCTKELCEAICQHIREGNTLKYSVQKEGIHYDTYRRWMQKGRNSKTKDGKFYAFFVAIKKAQEEGKNELVRGIKEHGKKQWQAMAWLLERMYYDEFGKKQQVEMEHSGEVKQKHTGQVKVDVHDRIRERAEEYRTVVLEPGHPRPYRKGE